ncbi:MAG TPA: DUF6279 family lipoprotein [Ideonella sp.]|nr:DUF6279 family lipoprotein [Ideonella sp.]
MRFSRAAIIGVLVLVAVCGLAGCSTALRLAYDQGPRLAFWWLDGYADFDEAQRAPVHDALDAWFEWDRRTQLPVYAGLLERAADEIARDAGAAQFCRYNDEARRLALRAFEQAVPAIVEIAPTLSEAQLAHIEQRFAKRNAEFRDDFRLDDSVAEQQRAALKRTRERAEMVYGSLDDAQRQRLARGLAASPFDAALWLDERMARQADIVATLRRLRRERLAPEQARQAVRDVALRIARSPRDGYRRYEAALTQYNCALAAEVHDTTTPEQRRHAVRRLEGWAGELRELAASRPPVSPRPAGS